MYGSYDSWREKHICQVQTILHQTERAKKERLTFAMTAVTAGSRVIRARTSPETGDIIIASKVVCMTAT